MRISDWSSDVCSSDLLHGDAAAKAVQQQGLLGFGKADLPWRAGMGERSKWRCARPAFKAGNGDMVRPGLADTGSDSADPDFRHQPHRDARAGVYVLQIVDELGQILDRIDVMVGRRRMGVSRKGGWVSARPISQGEPAWVSEVRGDAPVPP